MPFEDFYKKEAEWKHHWWKCVVLAFLLFVGYWSFALLTLPDSSREEAKPEFPLPAMERKDRVHVLCDSLPMPEDFQFAGKTNTTDVARFSSVSYNFKSSRSKEEIYPFFIIWFNTNGWIKAKDDYEHLKYRKGIEVVTIAQFHVKPDSYYMINCTEGNPE